MAKTSAHVMARSIGMDPKVFRTALNQQNFAWHTEGAGWSVETDSPEHLAMVAVLRQLFAAETKSPKPRAKARPRTRKKASKAVPQL